MSINLGGISVRGAIQRIDSVRQLNKRVCHRRRGVTDVLKFSRHAVPRRVYKYKRSAATSSSGCFSCVSSRISPLHFWNRPLSSSGHWPPLGTFNFSSKLFLFIPFLSFSYFSFSFFFLCYSSFAYLPLLFLLQHIFLFYSSFTYLPLFLFHLSSSVRLLPTRTCLS